MSNWEVPKGKRVYKKMGKSIHMNSDEVKMGTRKKDKKEIGEKKEREKRVKRITSTDPGSSPSNHYIWHKSARVGKSPWACHIFPNQVEAHLLKAI